MRIRREGNCRNKLSRSRRPRDAARSVSLKCVGDGDGTARSIARAAYVVVLRSTVLDSHWPGRVRARATGTVLLSGPRRPPRLSTLELLVAGYKCRVHHHHHLYELFRFNRERYDKELLPVEFFIYSGVASL